MDQHRKERGLNRCLRAIGLPKSTYYHRKRRPYGKGSGLGESTDGTPSGRRPPPTYARLGNPRHSTTFRDTPSCVRPVGVQSVGRRFLSFTGVDRTIRVISGDAGKIVRDLRKLQKENLAVIRREVSVVPMFYHCICKLLYLSDLQKTNVGPAGLEPTTDRL